MNRYIPPSKRLDKNHKWRANDIVELLEIKHAGDVFVSECKSGPTTSGDGHVRLDAWAMPRSWSKPWTTGYEIKVSRSDFERDEKWGSYLKLCHKLCFVCPAGLIKKTEIPDGVGLLYASVGETSGRLTTVVRPAIRDIQLPEDLYRYVLMSRCTVQRQGHFPVAGSFETWKWWVDDRAALRDVGRTAGKKIRRLLHEMKSEQSKEDETQKMIRESDENVLYRRLLQDAGLYGDITRDEFRKKVLDRLEMGSAAEVEGRVIKSLEHIRNTAEQAVKDVVRICRKRGAE